MIESGETSVIPTKVPPPTTSTTIEPTTTTTPCGAPDGVDLRLALVLVEGHSANDAVPEGQVHIRLALSRDRGDFAVLGPDGFRCAVGGGQALEVFGPAPVSFVSGRIQPRGWVAICGAAGDAGIVARCGTLFPSTFAEPEIVDLYLAVPTTSIELRAIFAQSDARTIDPVPGNNQVAVTYTPPAPAQATPARPARTALPSQAVLPPTGSTGTTAVLGAVGALLGVVLLMATAVGRARCRTARP